MEKFKLFMGMMVAANTAATAIHLCFFLCGAEADYLACMAMFLIARVMLFMANPSMPLNDRNVAIMSAERTLWNLMTMAVMWASYGIVKLFQLLISYFAA